MPPQLATRVFVLFFFILSLTLFILFKVLADKEDKDDSKLKYYFGMGISGFTCVLFFLYMIFTMYQ